MKKTSLMIVCLLMVSLFTFAQQDEKAVALNTSASSMAHFSWLTAETMDLGKIEKGKPVTVTFEFKNTGKSALLISSAKGQCGCTSVEYTKEAVAPGKKGFVKATYNAASAGAFTKSITVLANTQEQQIQLNIKGEVN